MATERIRSGFVKFAGYSVPLVQSMPVWTGLMTLPFAGYLITVFTKMPVNLINGLTDFSLPFLVPEKAFVVLGPCMRRRTGSIQKLWRILSEVQETGAFLNAFLKTNREGLDIVLSILIPAILLFVLMVEIQ